MSKLNLVMLVDDSPTDNLIHKKVIELSGLTDNVLVKTSGRSGLDFIEENKNFIETLPDIIFLDLNMPGINGFDFLLKFIEFPDEVKQKSKIIVLSSSDSHLDVDRATQYDCVRHYLTKPLNFEGIKAVKEKILIS